MFESEFMGASGAPAGQAAARAVPSEGDASPGTAGDPSITPIAITKCLGGEDWLEQALYLQHTDFSRLKKRLDAAREVIANWSNLSPYAKATILDVTKRSNSS